MCFDPITDYCLACCTHAICKACLKDYGLDQPFNIMTVTAARPCNECERVLRITTFADVPVLTRSKYRKLYTAFLKEVERFRQWDIATTGHVWLLPFDRAAWLASERKLTRFTREQWERLHRFKNHKKYVREIPTYTFRPPGYVVTGPSRQKYVQRHAVLECMKLMLDVLDHDHNLKLANNPNVPVEAQLFPLHLMLRNPNVTWAHLRPYQFYHYDCMEFRDNVNCQLAEMPGYVWDADELYDGIYSGEITHADFLAYPDLDWPPDAEAILTDMDTPEWEVTHDLTTPLPDGRCYRSRLFADNPTLTLEFFLTLRTADQNEEISGKCFTVADILAHPEANWHWLSVLQRSDITEEQTLAILQRPLVIAEPAHTYRAASTYDWVSVIRQTCNTCSLTIRVITELYTFFEHNTPMWITVAEKLDAVRTGLAQNPTFTLTMWMALPEIHRPDPEYFMRQTKTLTYAEFREHGFTLDKFEHCLTSETLNTVPLEALAERPNHTLSYYVNCRFGVE